MKKNRIYFLSAGVLNLFTAMLHTIGGQADLINPMLGSNLRESVKAELTGVWHMVTIVLFATSYYLLKETFSKEKKVEAFSIHLLQFIGRAYVLFSASFILTSIFLNQFAPQWILLFPIGLLTLMGVRRSR